MASFLEDITHLWDRRTEWERTDTGRISGRI